MATGRSPALLFGSIYIFMKTEKKRILAVDDQACNTRLVKLYLE